MNDQKRENSTIRKDILETLDELFPDNVIDICDDPDESYLNDIYEELRAELSRIETAAIDYERDWRGDDPKNYDQPIEWRFEEGEDEEPEFSDPLDYSYHLFFLGLKGEQFRYEVKDKTIDEEGKIVPDEGFRTIGCCVGISLTTPFALIVPDSLVSYKDGSQSYPDIEPHIFIDNDGPVDMEEYMSEMVGDEGMQALKELTNRITSILESFGISILPADQAEKPVPWLKAAEWICFADIPEKKVKLKDVFFFCGIY